MPPKASARAGNATATTKKSRASHPRAGMNKAVRYVEEQEDEIQDGEEGEGEVGEEEEDDDGDSDLPG
jgi:hypothetical protein